MIMTSSAYFCLIFHIYIVLLIGTGIIQMVLLFVVDTQYSTVIVIVSS